MGWEPGTLADSSCYVNQSLLQLAKFVTAAADGARTPSSEESLLPDFLSGFYFDPNFYGNHVTCISPAVESKDQGSDEGRTKKALRIAADAHRIKKKKK